MRIHMGRATIFPSSQAGVVDKAGSWFSAGDQRIGQGREAAKQFLAENPDVALKIEQQIMHHAGLLTDAMTTGPEADDDLDDDDNPDLKAG